MGGTALSPGARGEARAGLGHSILESETYPVQGDVGNLETQNDDPEESQDERLVSIHNVLWPDEGYGHLRAWVIGLSHEASVPEKPGVQEAVRWEGPGIRPPPASGPPGRAGNGQCQEKDGVLNSWDIGLSLPVLSEQVNQPG